MGDSDKDEYSKITRKLNIERELENCVYIINEIKNINSIVDTDAEFRMAVVALMKISDV
tara:strand:- start:1638 stop:1814 length:177 start_codon:yes stop_codon:yes gene_type:complete